jgi:hypothetical protein
MIYKPLHRKINIDQHQCSILNTRDTMIYKPLHRKINIDQHQCSILNTRDTMIYKPLHRKINIDQHQCSILNTRDNLLHLVQKLIRYKKTLFNVNKSIYLELNMLSMDQISRLWNICYVFIDPFIVVLFCFAKSSYICCNIWLCWWFVSDNVYFQKYFEVM